MNSSTVCADWWFHPCLITGKSGLCWNKGHEIVGSQHVSAYGHSTWQLAMKKSGVKQHPSCWNFDWLIDFAYNVCLPPANPAFPYEKEWFLVVSHTNTYYFLRVISWQSSWHTYTYIYMYMYIYIFKKSIWHSIWHSISHMYILSAILPCQRANKLAMICSHFFW